MPKAEWNGIVLAQTDNYEIVEGNIYFPPSSLNSTYFEPSDKHTTCPWKGVASYYNIKLNNNVSVDAAWYYPEPKSAASNIKGYVAFWKDVKVTK